MVENSSLQNGNRFVWGVCVCVCVCVCVIYQNHELGKYKMDEYCLCAENGFTL